MTNRNDHDEHPTHNERGDRPKSERSERPRESDAPVRESGSPLVAYTLRDNGPDRDPFWRAIGAGFPHKDGKGIDVVLDAMPHDGRVTLREKKREEFKDQRRNVSEERPRSQSREPG